MRSRYFSKHRRHWNVRIKSDGENYKSGRKFRGSMLFTELGQFNYCQTSHTEAKKYLFVFNETELVGITTVCLAQIQNETRLKHEKGLAKLQENCQNSMNPSQDMKWAPPEYRCKVLPLQHPDQ